MCTLQVPQNLDTLLHLKKNEGHVKKRKLLTNAVKWRKVGRGTHGTSVCGPFCAGPIQGKARKDDIMASSTLHLPPPVFLLATVKEGPFLRRADLSTQAQIPTEGGKEGRGGWKENLLERFFLSRLSPFFFSPFLAEVLDRNHLPLTVSILSARMTSQPTAVWLLPPPAPSPPARKLLLSMSSATSLLRKQPARALRSPFSLAS